MGVVNTGVDDSYYDALAFVSCCPGIVGVDLGNAPGNALTALFSVRGSYLDGLDKTAVFVGCPLDIGYVGSDGHESDGCRCGFAVNTVGKPE